MKEVYNELEKSTFKRKIASAASQDREKRQYKRRSLRRPSRPSLVDINDDGSPIPIVVLAKENLVNSDELRFGREKVAKFYNAAEITPNQSETLAIPPVPAEATGANRTKGWFYPKLITLSTDNLNNYFVALTGYITRSNRRIGLRQENEAN